MINGLVTGFGSFEGYKDNPSAKLAKLFAEAVGLPYEVLPVEYRTVRRWVVNRRNDPPDLLISLGVSPNVKAPTLELFGRNEVTQRPDVAGYVPKTDRIHVAKNGMQVLGSTLLSAQGLAEMEIPVSYSAGGYLCNFLLFETLFEWRSSKIGFLHIAPEDVTPLDRQLESLLGFYEVIRQDFARTQSRA